VDQDVLAALGVAGVLRRAGAVAPALGQGVQLRPELVEFGGSEAREVLGVERRVPPFPAPSGLLVPCASWRWLSTRRAKAMCAAARSGASRKSSPRKLRPWEASCHQRSRPSALCCSASSMMPAEVVTHQRHRFVDLFRQL
jgi:hypothetical protein